MIDHGYQTGFARTGIDVTILIVNWNSSQYLKACLSSIYNNVKGVSIEVIVVDNASYDGSAELLSNEFPTTIFIQSDSNLGFARANNLAYRQSRGQMILFLNPDTKLLDDAVTTMYLHMQRLSSVGAVTCRVLNSDLSPQTWHLQPFPTICNQFLDAEIVKRTLSMWNPVAPTPGSDTGSNSTGVEVITASCLMVSRVAFEEVGLFDEQYWMYGEDVHLCYRLRRAGYSIEYIGQGTVVHHGARNTPPKDRSDFAATMGRESVAVFFRQTKGNVYAAVYKMSVGVASLLRLLVIVIVALAGGVVLHRSWVYFTGRRWLKIFGWSIGLQRWTKMGIRRQQAAL